MTKGRMAVAIAAAFVVSQILAVAVHGFLLNADYEPFRGTLLRADASWQMLTLPVAHLLFISALVWVFAHADFRGSMLAQGAKLGVLGWMAGQAPLWLLWLRRAAVAGPARRQAARPRARVVRGSGVDDCGRGASTSSSQEHGQRRIIRGMIRGIGAAVLLLAALAQQPGYRITHRYSVGGEGFWDYVVPDPPNHRLFIARQNRVMVVDEDNGTLLGEVTGINGAHGTAIAADTGHGFATSGNDQSVVMFDLKTLQGARPDSGG